MSVYDEPKIDCHNHLLDPGAFPYNPRAWYHPVANEQGSAEQLATLFDAYGSTHALVVGPNSGYDTDNRCLLDAIAHGDALQRAINRISVEQRTILALHHLEERPVAEIAAFLGIPVGTSKWRLYEARAALERAMETQR